MSIDPEDFVSQGKPTVKQVENVWNSLPAPSARSVADELTKRGWSISWRTVARYKERNWSEKLKGRHVDTAPPIGARQHRPAEVTKQVKKAVAKLPEEAQRVAMEGLENAIGKPTIEEIKSEVLRARIEKMLTSSEAELDVMEGKARKIYNILLMEEAMRRVEVMVLIPRDTAALVQAMTVAAGAQLSGGEGQPPKAGDPRVIDGTVVEPEPEPINDTASAIRRFQKANGAA